MEWHILDTGRQKLLKHLANEIDLDDYYMAGGTALSLQMGLRESVDFDFFVPHSFDTEYLYSQFHKMFPQLKVLQHTDRTLDMKIDGVQVSYFNYEYNMINPYINDKDLPTLSMASPQDIAAMKISAIGSRGEKKDFFDLYQICTRLDIPPVAIPELLEEKFGKEKDLFYMVIGLGYFDDTEKTSLPKTFVKYDWNSIKIYFGKYQKEVQSEYFKRQKRENGTPSFKETTEDAKRQALIYNALHRKLDEIRVKEIER